MKITSAKFVVSAAGPKQYPAGGLPEVALVGRSNVGKSSLLNSLVNRRKLALTSGTPGKTRLINFFLINEKFYLVDLPGYGFARVSHGLKKSWAKTVETYLRERETLRLAVLLLDVRHPPTADDLLMYRWLVHFSLPTVIVATKADKISRGAYQKHLDQIRRALKLGPEGPVILYSSQTGQGRDQLWQILKQYLPEPG
ncbi:MAG: YihA family ribosome biogenesis GTP-binding protein [Firmicutes bacterium]|jgi:GTP-binding protein|nr:YihA family ribosome biogenesis GTP-binding protein [Bacillota bacterium]